MRVKAIIVYLAFSVALDRNKVINLLFTTILHSFAQSLVFYPYLCAKYLTGAYRTEYVLRQMNLS